MITTFMSRLGLVMVSIELAPHGNGTRAVTVWTWEGGPRPQQHKPFFVPSLEEARTYIPVGSLRVTSMPAGFAEEAYLYAPVDGGQA